MRGPSEIFVARESAFVVVYLATATVTSKRGIFDLEPRSSTESAFVNVHRIYLRELLRSSSDFACAHH
jgi:hypothetical protein